MMMATKLVVMMMMVTHGDDAVPDSFLGNPFIRKRVLLSLKIPIDRNSSGL